MTVVNTLTSSSYRLLLLIGVTVFSPSTSYRLLFLTVVTIFTIADNNQRFDPHTTQRSHCCWQWSVFTSHRSLLLTVIRGLNQRPLILTVIKGLTLKQPKDHCCWQGWISQPVVLDECVGSWVWIRQLVVLDECVGSQVWISQPVLDECWKPGLN